MANFIAMTITLRSANVKLRQKNGVSDNGIPMIKIALYAIYIEVSQKNVVILLNTMVDVHMLKFKKINVIAGR